MAPAETLAVGVAGLGSVGLGVARSIDGGAVTGLRLAAVSSRSPRADDDRMSCLGGHVQSVPLEALASLADVIVECLPPECFKTLAEPVVQSKGKVMVVASAGALLAADDLIEEALKNGVRIIVPSGAVTGLDGLRAAMQTGIDRVRLVTRKPPLSLGLQEALEQPVCVFEGMAREAISRFPKNINVAATVSMAGLGADRTEVQIWADPAVSSNQHELHVWSPLGEMTSISVNAPSASNPRTSAITGFSILAALQRLREPISIGS